MLAADFERREARAMADLKRGHLIGRHADFDIRAAGLAHMAAGEKRGQGAGMVAAAVAMGKRVVLSQAG